MRVIRNRNSSGLSNILSFEIKYGEVCGDYRDGMEPARARCSKSSLRITYSRVNEMSEYTVEWHIASGGRHRFSSELTGRENIYLDGAILG